MITFKKIAVLLLIISIAACKTETTGWRYYEKPYITKYYNSLPKEIKEVLKAGFTRVAGGNYVSGKVIGNDTFSAILHEKRVTISSMYMAKHEVSVAEFMEFYDETRNEANKPDTLCFLYDFADAYNEPMAAVYFWHPKYRKQNYPICGVSLEQALRFCQWKTYKINAQLKAIYGANAASVVFRLPTAAELEYAMSIAKTSKAGQPSQLETNLKNSNTKGIVDENGITVTAMGVDGFLYTAPAKQYKPNAIGLYNIYGNVAEWTATPAYMLCSRWKFENNTLERVVIEYKDLVVDTTLIPADNPNYARMLEIVKDTTYYITKGGSYAHGQYYIQPAAFIPVKQNESHSWLGFRLVMEVGPM